MVPQRQCCTRTSFMHSVLTALSTLQSNKGNTSIKLPDLIKYIEFSYNLKGDVQSQVKSVLNTAQDMNYVLKMNDRYSLLSPAARLQLVPALCFKEELKRIEGIFQFRKRRASVTNICNSSKRTKCDSPARITRSNCQLPEGQCPTSVTPKKVKHTSLSFLKKLWPAALLTFRKQLNYSNTRASSISQCRLNCNKKSNTRLKANTKVKKKKYSPACKKSSLEKLRDRILANRTRGPSYSRSCCCDSPSSSSCWGNKGAKLFFFLESILFYLRECRGPIT